MSTIQKPNFVENDNSRKPVETSPTATPTKSEEKATQPLVNPYREDESRKRLDTKKGFVVDRDGRVNNYAVKPAPYLQNEPRFGFTRYAEIWNGRLAMIGFAASIITELIAGKSLFAYWFGLG
jgi:hypothetical protein